MKVPLRMLLPLAAALPAPADVSWHREVAPILRANCISCHKPGKAKGGLDLTTPESTLRGGKDGPDITPGDAGSSSLIDSVCGEEPDMPKEGEPLSAAEVDVLVRWIRSFTRLWKGLNSSR